MEKPCLFTGVISTLVFVDFCFLMGQNEEAEGATRRQLQGLWLTSQHRVRVYTIPPTSLLYGWHFTVIETGKTSHPN